MRRKEGKGEEEVEEGKRGGRERKRERVRRAPERESENVNKVFEINHTSKHFCMS